MKKITNLKDKLIAVCPHPELLDDANCDGSGNPVSELGYVRCDHDGYMCHSTFWPVHDDLCTGDLAKEFDSVLDAFRRTFKDRQAMSKWCHANAGKTSAYDEFNAYYEGDLGFYWFRMITRRGDYNLYLHCLSKSVV